MDGARWFRATACGLERDRVVVKSSGEATYLLPDLAYHRQKFARGFDRVIDLQGADHKEQFPYVVAGAGALGCPVDRLELVMNQFVTLTRGGEQVKQSTRRATYVTVDELLEEVGADVFRFFMVQRRAESHLDFDVDLAKDTDWKKNPAYYVQYAHARTHAIERKARELGVALPDAANVDADPLVLPEEIEILKKISEFPEVVQRASDTREPHHLCYYARELAGLWNPYQQDGVRHRVLSDDPRSRAPGWASRSGCGSRSRVHCDYWASPPRSECDEREDDRRNAGWVSTLVALVVLVVVGFLCGALAGFLWEEPGLVLAYLSGKTEPVEFSEPACGRGGAAGLLRERRARADAHEKLARRSAAGEPGADGAPAARGARRGAPAKPPAPKPARSPPRRSP
jgi:hypothetical protein